MSDNGQGPTSGKVVGNGPRVVARGCQGSPEVPVDLKRGLQTAPGPGEAAGGQFRPKLTIRAAAPCLKISTCNRTSPGLGSYARVIGSTHNRLADVQ